jgi:hypothetical protein
MIDATYIQERLQADADIAALSFVRGFKNAVPAPVISYPELEQEYCRLMGLPYPVKEMPYVQSWMLFRVSPFYL